MTVSEINRLAIIPGLAIRCWVALQFAVCRWPNRTLASILGIGVVAVAATLATRLIEIYWLGICIMIAGGAMWFHALPLWGDLATPRWYRTIEGIVGSDVAKGLRAELARRHFAGHTVTQWDVFSALAQVRRASVDAGAIHVGALKMEGDRSW